MSFQLLVFLFSKIVRRINVNETICLNDSLIQKMKNPMGGYFLRNPKKRILYQKFPILKYCYYGKAKIPFVQMYFAG